MNSDYVTRKELVTALCEFLAAQPVQYTDVTSADALARRLASKLEAHAAQPETSPSPCRCGAKAEVSVSGQRICCSRGAHDGPWQEVYGPDPARVLAAWNVLVGPDKCGPKTTSGFYHAHGWDDPCPLTGHRALCAALGPGKRDCDRKCAPDPVEEK